MTAVKQPDFITVEEYLAGEETSGVKHEYLGGTVHAMGGFSNQHNTIALNSLVLLHGDLRGKKFQAFTSDTKVRIEFPDHTRLYYPDAMVVCDSRSATDHFQDRPVVIIEVLSESTRRADLGEKRDAYLTISTLKVLLFVEPDSPAVTLYRRKAEGGFDIERHTGLESTIPLPEIEATLPLADLYERVELKA
ncbi:MAG: Uma2 family endonuclease [Verrucomicrobiota bacterium]